MNKKGRMKLTRRLSGVYLVKKLGWEVAMSLGLWIFTRTGSIFSVFDAWTEVSKRKPVYMLERKYQTKWRREGWPVYKSMFLQV